MSFEFFTIAGRSFHPKASIRKQGQIGLNQGAIKRFGIEDGQLFILGYDKEREIIAMKRISDFQEGAKKITVRAGNGAIGAKSFLDYFEISYKDTSSHELTEENELLIFSVVD